LRGGKSMIDGKAFDPTKAYKDSKVVTAGSLYFPSLGSNG
jgi:hypothetical protein